jgi:prepilin-type N-terminal cleavage/methylation domain-containing protein
MSAFTLVEILIVVVILAILAGIVVPQLASATDETYLVSAKSCEKALQSGIAMYLNSRKKFPPTFYTWVALGDHGSSLNSVHINSKVRSQLVDPAANVLSGNDKIITLRFKNGLTAVYTIGDGGRITAIYSGP